MPISEAALSGIRDNGHKWKHQIKLSDLTSRLGKEEDTLTLPAIEEIRNELVRRCKNFSSRTTISFNMQSRLDNCIDELEMVDPDLDEVRYALNLLYDEFDYWRVVVI